MDDGLGCALYGFKGSLNDVKLMIEGVSDVLDKINSEKKTKFSQKNLKILKKILLLLKDVSNGDFNDEFGLEKCANKLLRNYRYDLLLTLLSDEQKIIELEINDINDTEDKFRKTIDYRLYINGLDAFDKNPSFESLRSVCSNFLRTPSFSLLSLAFSASKSTNSPSGM